MTNWNDIFINAAFRGEVNNMKDALKNGADINALDIIQIPALIYVSFYGHTDCLKYLLSCDNLDINQMDSHGNTALMSSVSSKDTTALKMLIKEKTNLNTKNKAGYNAITYADMNKNTDAIEILIKAGANTDNLKDETKEKFSTLIDAENKKKSSLNNDLLGASLVGNLNDIKKAVESGADVNAKGVGVSYSSFPLILATFHNNPKSVEYLASSDNIDLNQIDAFGNSALISAVISDNTDSLKHLINAKAELEIVNKSKNTAIQQAELYANTDAIEILIKAGANTDNLSPEYKEQYADLIKNVKSNIVDFQMASKKETSPKEQKVFKRVNGTKPKR